ncbi:MAG: peptidase [Caldibacillus debilis]|uniref:Peptidase n=2 Tax=Caldibacillus debilis TaxID=301148 RepID=A0A3E0K7J4_9BACI|nr:S41 family peptidase [Caldibacillus debilis]REJ30451.1 MAG: peptidase [Caldibacillus debilis]
MYEEIFLEVISIVRNDYAGCLDKKGWDRPEPYLETIRRLEAQQALTPAKFHELVQDYLLDFKDPHMYFLLKTDAGKETDAGFAVRRYMDRLYVTSAGREKRLAAGDSIRALDGIPIGELAEKHQRELMDEIPERQNWNKIIKKYKKCQVVTKAGTEMELELSAYPKEKYEPCHEIREIDENILLMTLTDFENPDKIRALIEENAEKLERCRYWVIDVRKNRGGTDAAFLRLLPYLFPEGKNVLTMEEDWKMTFHCTERNYHLTVEQIQSELRQIRDEETRKTLENFMERWRKNKGKGFVRLFEEDFEAVIEGRRLPEKVVILTDTGCGSSGENFVEICKKSPKVTVIGRPTAGVNGYANLAVKEWDDFQFYFPTSRLDKMDKVKNLLDLAAHPDVYLPWTPGHLQEDADLKEALRFLKGGPAQ